MYERSVAGKGSRTFLHPESKAREVETFADCARQEHGAVLARPPLESRAVGYDGPRGVVSDDLPEVSTDHARWGFREV